MQLFFQFWKENVKLVLRKNETYYQKDLPLLDAVAITFIKDKQTAFLEFIKGNLDFISGLDASYKDEVLTPYGQLQEQYVDKIQLQSLPYLNTEYLGFLMDDKNLSPTQHLAVRKAINFGFDRVKMMTYLRNNIGQAATKGFVPQGLPSYTDSLKGYVYNPDRSRLLLKEAAIDLPRLAGLKPAGVIVEIMNEDGSMARVPDLIKVAEKFKLKIISIEDLVAYRMEHDSLIVKKEDFEINTRFGSYRLRAYEQTTNNSIHIALTMGSWEKGDEVLTRINSKSINNDILGTLTNNVEDSLNKMFKLINKNQSGAIIFINPEQKSLDTLKRLNILKKKQVKNKVTKAPIIGMDERDFGIGAQILHDLDITNLKLISNTKGTKRVGMIGYGLEISEHINF